MKKETYLWILLCLGAIFFSSWLMIHTFSYEAKTSSMLIASKAWSDFGAHIPLIRSFSLGNNWPPEYPLFPGEPIRYHFLFYFLVGMFEKAGVRIDWALNIPSILGFAGLVIGIALVAQKLFKDIRVTILSVAFFLFNGSLSWIQFFKDHPLSFNSIKNITTNTTFTSFAPWGKGDISAFWSLNIYTNQRHLGAAFALALLFIGILIYIEKKPFKKQALFVIPEIAILTLLPYFHQPILIILAVFMMCYFILLPRLRGVLLLIGSIGLVYIIPQVIPLFTGPKTVAWQPGYLVTPPLTIIKIIWYWVQNIGLHSVFIPLGWFLAPTRVKKLTIPLFFLFLIPNLFQFSVEMAANHKFFNFFLIIGNMLSAYALIRICSHAWKQKIYVYLCRMFTIMCITCLMVSGIIDFFPIVNDQYLKLEDIPQNEIATWIRDNTPPDAIILNSSYFFHPASIAGRKIFQGWPYFTWSAGYTEKRDEIMKKVYESSNIVEYCTLLQKYRISYITVERIIDDPNLPQINPNSWKSQSSPVYEHEATQYYIYATNTICTNNK